MEKKTNLRCISIKSKKHPELRCPNTSKNGTDWCSNHMKTKIQYVEAFEEVKTSEISSTISCSNAAACSHPIAPKRRIPSKKVKELAAKLLQKFWILYGRKLLYRQLAHNDKEISTYDVISSVPLCYRFSYLDSKHHLWLFDTRFFINLLQYGNDVKNPFTQELVDRKIVERLQKRSEQLLLMKKPIVYIQEEELTPEQLWNQKVLDVFLKLTSLGYSVNVQWFETLTLRGHEMFYTKLFQLWNVELNLREEEKERIIPGCNDGRTLLFRWHPTRIVGTVFEIKWWRKQTIRLMRTFLTRTEDKDIQSCGALYILTALANVHPRCGECFPWLVEDIE